MISPAWVRSSSPTITRHGSAPGEVDGALDRVVIGDAQHVDARLGDGLRRSRRASSSSRRSTSCGCACRRAPNPSAVRSARCGWRADGGGEWGRHERQRYRAREARLRVAGVVATPQAVHAHHGRCGFLGQHLAIASEADEWELFAPPSTMIDIRRRERVIEEICEWKPDGDRAPRLPQGRSPHRSSEGSRNIAEAAAICGARLVHMRTDAIFPGRPEPYREYDAPYPDHRLRAVEARGGAGGGGGVPGRCAGAHFACCTARDGSLRSRPTWNCASTGQRPMRFFTDEYRCPAHARRRRRSTQFVGRAAGIRGPLNVAGPEAVSRAELAEAFARWMGFDPRGSARERWPLSGTIRPGRVVLDTTLAQTRYGIECRPLSETLRPSIRSARSAPVRCRSS